MTIRVLRLTLRLFAVHAAMVIGLLAIARVLPPVGEIAFVVEIDRIRSLYVVDAATQIAHLLARNATNPVWSPDGAQIAYESVGQERDIYVMDAAGAHRRNLSQHRASDYGPAWMFDGQRIGFVSERDNYSLRPGIAYLVNTDGTELHGLVNMQMPAWSRDADRMAYVSEGHIYIADTHGSLIQRFPVPDLNRGAPNSLTWLPGGEQIALRFSSGPESTIYTLDTTTGDMRYTLGPLILDDMPVWSPDGSRVAFSIRGRNIFLLEIATGDIANLTGSAATLNYFPAWSPDGSRLAFVSYREGQPGLYIVDREQVYRIASFRGLILSPTWRP